MSSSPLPYKQDVANQLLIKGSLFIHLDPRVDDVEVPPWLKHQAQLVLQVGYNMPIPIQDLQVDDDGILGTLSFSRTPFTCKVPWSSVFALVGDTGRGMVWPENMPPEVVSEVERELHREKSKETARLDSPLQKLTSQGSSASSVTSSVKTKGKKELPPYLRVIK